MARVNAAYEKGDLTALEVMAERVGAGEPPGELSPEERQAHLERRAAVLARIAASLARERDRLVRSDTHRLREEARKREAEGKDFLAESRAGIVEEAEAAYADARARLARLSKVARDVGRARSIAMKQLEKRGPTGARRAFDPLQEAELVRLGASRLERQRANGAARELARTLEAQAETAPWDVALTLLAFFAEEAGGRPPEALRSPEGWSLRWDRLREAWPAARNLPRTLARLPRWLAVGARAEGDGVEAGPQLVDAALLAGVRIALERTSVARLARAVLAALGPDVACEACGARGAGLHLHRTRGLDELHGIVCPGCGEVVRSYWQYGEADGRGALAARAPARPRRRGDGAARGDRDRLPDAPGGARAAHRRAAPAPIRRADLTQGRAGRRTIAVASGRGELAAGTRLAPAERLRFTVRADAGDHGGGAARAAPRAHRAALQAARAGRGRVNRQTPAAATGGLMTKSQVQILPPQPLEAPDANRGRGLRVPAPNPRLGGSAHRQVARPHPAHEHAPGRRERSAAQRRGRSGAAASPTKQQSDRGAPSSPRTV